jgi:hypothetical protein
MKCTSYKPFGQFAFHDIPFRTATNCHHCASRPTFRKRLPIPSSFIRPIPFRHRDFVIGLPVDRLYPCAHFEPFAAPSIHHSHFPPVPPKKTLRWPKKTLAIRCPICYTDVHIRLGCASRCVRSLTSSQHLSPHATAREAQSVFFDNLPVRLFHAPRGGPRWCAQCFNCCARSRCNRGLRHAATKTPHRISPLTLRDSQTSQPSPTVAQNIAGVPLAGGVNVQYLTPTHATLCVNAKRPEYRTTPSDLCDNPPAAPGINA